MSDLSVNVASKTTTQTIELTLKDAPSMKVEYVYYDITGLRLTYEGDQLTQLTVLGTAEDTREAEEISTRLDRYDWVEPWIRNLVDEHRPAA